MNSTHQHTCRPLSMDDVADWLGVAPQTIRVWRVRGRMLPPTWTVGHSPLWCRHDLARWNADTDPPRPASKGVGA